MRRGKESWDFAMRSRVADQNQMFVSAPKNVGLHKPSYLALVISHIQ